MCVPGELRYDCRRRKRTELDVLPFVATSTTAILQRALRECTCVEETCSTVAGFCRGLRESAPPLGNCEQSDGLQSSFSCRREWRCVHLEGDFAFRREPAVECESLDEGSECTCFYSGLEATFEPLGAYANLATCDAALDTCMGLQAGWLL